MRILHIVSLITPTGSYGGPLRVAVGQVTALVEQGHDVTLIAGTMGYGKDIPSFYDGIEVKLFKASVLIPYTGFAGITSPRLLLWVSQNAKNYDVIHIHLARDLLTLVATQIVRKSGVPYVVQTHGMIDPSKNLLAKPLDFMMTKPAIRNASRVLFLNIREKEFLSIVAGKEVRFRELRNGIRESNLCVMDKPKKSNMEVIFLSRLDPQKRGVNFVKMAVMLHQRFPDTMFTLIGPDEGDGPRVLQTIKAEQAGHYINWEGPLPPNLTQNRMAASDLYVLPSLRDAFPMSVLEAMSLAIPVVVTESCGFSEEILVSGAGIVVRDDSIESLADGVAELLSSKKKYMDASEKALSTIRDKFSINSVIFELMDIYDQTKRGL